MQASGGRSACETGVAGGLLLVDEARSRGYDARAAITLTAGLMAMAFGVHQSIDSGWVSAQTLVPLLGGVGVLAVFAFIESRVADPLIPLRVLSQRALLSANLAAGLLSASFLGLIYEATLFVQQGLGYSPLAAGASTIPIAVLSLGISARVAPRAIDRVGAATTLAVGMAIQALGLLLLSRIPTDASYLVDILPAYCVVGGGLGLATVAVQIAAFAGVERDDAGLAGGVMETSREMGGALGLAVLVSVALAGTTDMTDAFHRSVQTAALFAAASALVAVLLLRPIEAAVPALSACSHSRSRSA